VAQCVWWLAAIIGLEQGLVNYIDNIQSWIEVTVSSKETTDNPAVVSKESREDQKDKVLSECEEYLQESRRQRDLVTRKATGKTKTGRINPLASTRQQLRIDKDKARSRVSRKSERIKVRDNDKTKGIQEAEIQRQNLAGECLRCTWPPDRKGTHRVKDCIRPIKLDKGTASYPKGKDYHRQQPSETESDSDSNLEEEVSSN
jgi:hypothetical protein